ncbi:MAG TPA: hypothetical protein ENI87_15505 [bacterium]|nr:hypothetical protein [bacterium]
MRRDHVPAEAAGDQVAVQHAGAADLPIVFASAGGDDGATGCGGHGEVGAGAYLHAGAVRGGEVFVVVGGDAQRATGASKGSPGSTISARVIKPAGCRLPLRMGRFRRDGAFIVCSADEDRHHVRLLLPSRRL